MTITESYSLAAVFTPIHVKAFLKSLTDSVEKYEKRYGQISTETADKILDFK